jgi:hypothetical protein
LPVADGTASVWLAAEVAVNADHRAIWHRMVKSMKVIQPDPHELSTLTRCAHRPCTCFVALDSALVIDSRHYCCTGCASARGCDHGDCACDPGEDRDQ